MIHPISAAEQCEINQLSIKKFDSDYSASRTERNKLEKKIEKKCKK